MIKLYHGTNLSSAFDICLHGIDLSKSLPNLDFGKGFYVTDNKKKAIDRARKKTRQYNIRNKCREEAYIVEVYVSEDLFIDMNYKELAFRSEEWFRFVVNNRLDINFLNKNKISIHNKDNKYDVVYGEIADGSISDLINEIKQRRCSIETIDYSVILPDTMDSYGNQYSFHTEKSLTCIDKVSCDIIKTGKMGERR